MQSIFSIALIDDAVCHCVLYTVQMETAKTNTPAVAFATANEKLEMARNGFSQKKIKKEKKKTKTNARKFVSSYDVEYSMQQYFISIRCDLFSPFDTLQNALSYIHSAHQTL